MTLEPTSPDDFARSSKELNELSGDWLSSREVSDTIFRWGELAAASIRSGGQVFFAGNGGSFSDAQHMAAELVGKLDKVRSPYAGVALGSNPAILSAIANDFGWEHTLTRELSALGRPGDTLLIFSTSGESSNLLGLPELALSLGVTALALLGKGGGTLRSTTDCLVVPSANTQRVQELHTFLGHEFCRAIEVSLAPEIIT